MDMVIIFLNTIMLIFEYYMFNHLQTFPNLCENLYFMQLMSFFYFEILKGKPKKSIKVMPQLKLSKHLRNKQKLQLVWIYENMVTF